MANFELVMPKMGESIMEATILKWVKKPGDFIKADESILEIATDKVDSEVPSPVGGILKEVLFKENDVVPVGKIIAIIATESTKETSPSITPPSTKTEAAKIEKNTSVSIAPTTSSNTLVQDIKNTNGSGRFYSPLVKNIAKNESISFAELEAVAGTGKEGRVTKKDMLEYVSNRKEGANSNSGKPISTQPVFNTPAVSITGNVEIIEMDRMRKLIADHMVMSKHTSPHVTSFVETDVTNIVLWREKAKKIYETREGEKITFTPIFIEAVVKAIKDFPLVNSSVDGTKMIIRKDINIGMAAALPSGNLIVPVIKNADQKNMIGLTKEVNDLAKRARAGQLKPEEIQGGTFTLTNVGTFGNLMGTPIINQPQVAILATGSIKKKPVVLETDNGDVIAIRHMMFLSLSYDHRIVDGALGGSFLKRIADYLEKFDLNKEI